MYLPFIRISFSRPGMSAVTIVIYACSVKYSPTPAFHTILIPLCNWIISSTRGQRKESRSLGLFGPGVNPTRNIFLLFERIDGGRLRFIQGARLLWLTW